MNDDYPFNINTHLIIPFCIVVGLCFVIMVSQFGVCGSRDYLTILFSWDSWWHAVYENVEEFKDIDCRRPH